MKFDFLSDAQIDTAALALKVDALSGPKFAQVPVDLDALVFDFLCERDELSVDFDSLLEAEGGEEVLGKTTMIPGRIQVSSHLKQDSGRFRFTLAHEIGHWILHRPVILAALEQPGLFGELSTGATLTTLNRSIAGPRPPREEIQANRFAATLLVDHKLLRSEFLARFGVEGPNPALRAAGFEKASPRAQARFLAAAGRGTDLASHFGVSVEAMAIALEGRKYLPQGRSLFEE